MRHNSARKLVAAMRAGRDFPRNERLYAIILRAHVRNEDERLLPMADRLPPRYQEALAEAFDRVERQEIGPGAHARLEARIEGLTRWGRAQAPPGA